MAQSTVCFLTALFAAACTFHKGDDGAREDAAPPRPPATVAPGPASPGLSVHSDIGGLRHYIELPEGVTHCRWITRAKGDGVLGPSDYVLTAFVELSPAGWNELSCDGGPREAAHKMDVDATEARSLLPGNAVVSLATTAGGRLLVPSTPLAAGCIRSALVLNVRSVNRVGDGL